MPDRERRSVRWSPVWRVVCAAALDLQQIAARYEIAGVCRRNVWGEKERPSAKVWWVRLVGSVPYASVILPTMSQPTSAVSEVAASTGGRTATHCYVQLHK